MRVIDRLTIRLPPERVWPHAVRVEQWPVILPHYRWVTRLEGGVEGDGVVEMAAWRPFGPARWPTWWQSTMQVDAARHRITYRHVAGITRGMDVWWTIDRTPEGWSDVKVVHEWSGPAWPVVGGAAANLVIGPVFIHGIASRTLAGVARAAEGRA